MLKKYIDMVSNNRGTDDDYYYLIFDEETGELFIEHSWHYWSPNNIKQGEEKWTFAELKRKKPAIYEMALELIKNTLFAEKSI